MRLRPFKNMVLSAIFLCACSTSDRAIEHAIFRTETARSRQDGKIQTSISATLKAQDQATTSTLTEMVSTWTIPPVLPTPVITTTNKPTITLAPLMPSLTPSRTIHVPRNRTPSATMTPSSTPVSSSDTVYVHEGAFIMGSPFGAGQGDEHPPHDVFLSSYRIDRTEVTNRMFSEFLNAVGNQKEEGTLWFNADEPPRIEWSTYRSMITFSDGSWHPVEGYEDFPVVMVTWYGAKAYCEWTGRRLPTEAEWEKAARGSLSWTFPWGEEPPSCEKANLLPACGGGLFPVGTLLDGASPYGALDMSGNVAEWTSDWHLGYYSQDIPYLNPQGPDEGGRKVYKGGAWLPWRVWPVEDNGRSADRSSWAPRSGNGLLGFRCAMDASN